MSAYINPSLKKTTLNPKKKHTKEVNSKKEGEKMKMKKKHIPCRSMSINRNEKHSPMI